eukprot:4850731-Alexandrium_andersonii.AAC.1
MYPGAARGHRSPSGPGRPASARMPIGGTDLHQHDASTAHDGAGRANTKPTYPVLARPAHAQT